MAAVGVDVRGFCTAISSGRVEPAGGHDPSYYLWRLQSPRNPSQLILTVAIGPSQLPIRSIFLCFACDPQDLARHRSNLSQSSPDRHSLAPTAASARSR
jgi:hypothetical protein